MMVELHTCLLIIDQVNDPMSCERGAKVNNGGFWQHDCDQYKYINLRTHFSSFSAVGIAVVDMGS